MQKEWWVGWLSLDNGYREVTKNRLALARSPGVDYPTRYERLLEYSLQDARWCHECWDTLDAACYVPFGEARRREHLAELRRLLGPLRYHAGAMPPPVPTWRFSRCD